ncbi:hypothetical protein C5C03_04075 [Clavibacter michiganensis]|uniref:helix-turn-helix transcriptional regulator n=1 Tax=Clavibacter michiganensis TaxID=28447 RepID=UPI000CE7A8E4|nr:hypothetical protein [Clavibacter michiganensis]PPF89274.1 hypothetical protein C5C03_04075 [Clavibacter michiganensis]PPF97314.1 hypothetical protein C5C05_05460 [Clavibacter michiganensis]
MAEGFITIDETASITGLKPAFLAQLRYKGTGPEFYKPSRTTVLYRKSEVLAWVEASKRTRSDQHAHA